MPFPNRATQFKPGQSGNPGGKTPGTLNLSTHIRNQLNDPEFEGYMLDAKVGVKTYKGMPIIAIIQVAMKRAISGDSIAREWLSKYGYGHKIELEQSEKSDLSQMSEEELNARLDDWYERHTEEYLSRHPEKKGISQSSTQR